MKSGMLNFTQFSRVIDLLQDALEGVDLTATTNDESGKPGKATRRSEPLETMSIAAMTPTAPALTGTGQADVGEDELLEDDSDMAEVAREIYDDLRGEKKTLSVKTFRMWSDVKDMLQAQVITEDDIDRGLLDVGVSKSDEITFPQFLELVIALDDIALADNDDALPDSDADFEIIPTDKGFGKSTSVSSGTVKMSARVQDASKDDADNDDADNDDADDDDADDENSEDVPELSPEELEEAVRQMYNDLRGKKDKLTVKDFMNWEDLKEMIEMDIVTNADVLEAVEGVGAKKNGNLEFAQFMQLVEMLDERAAEATGLLSVVVVNIIVFFIKNITLSYSLLCSKRSRL